MKRAPYSTTARRDQRLREIERTLWTICGATLVGVALATWMAMLTF